MKPGCLAGVEVGRAFDVYSDDPIIIQDTNNTVVWLRPHAVIAKVGTRADSVDGLVREHEVASALSALGAPVAAPLVGSIPMHHSSTGFMVTLWNLLDSDAALHVSETMVGGSLRQLQEALAATDIILPDFRIWLRRARSALADESRLASMTTEDIVILRDAFDSLLPYVEPQSFSQAALHGEPHDGNRLVTSSGIRWIDFESVCRGPIEWDLAFLSNAARKSFTGVDLELLNLLSTLNSARVATWCLIRGLPEMRWHGEHHLKLVRANLRNHV